MPMEFAGSITGVAVTVRLLQPSSREVTLLITGIEGEETRHLDERYLELITDYNDRASRVGVRHAGAPPPMPGLRLLNLNPHLSHPHPVVDTAASAAGGVTPWLATWRCWPRSSEDDLLPVKSIIWGFDDGVKDVPLVWT